MSAERSSIPDGGAEIYVVDRERLRSELLRVFSSAIVDRVLDRIGRACAPRPAAAPSDVERARAREAARRAGMHVRSRR